MKLARFDRSFCQIQSHSGNAATEKSMSGQLNDALQSKGLVP